jgi:VCBS repeat-containing protein
MNLSTRVVVPVVIAGALAVGAAAIARADSPSPSPSPSQSHSQKAHDGKKHAGKGGIERRALHGEFTVPQRGQGKSQSGTVQTQVVDSQRGEITAVDTKAKTLTVKSRDGFTRTYTVTSDTTIKSKGKDESFTDLKVGERAMVLSQKQGDKYVAQRIRCVHEPKDSSTGQSAT